MELDEVPALEQQIIAEYLCGRYQSEDGGLCWTSQLTLEKQTGTRQRALVTESKKVTIRVVEILFPQGFFF